MRDMFAWNACILGYVCHTVELMVKHTWVAQGLELQAVSPQVSVRLGKFEGYCHAHGQSQIDGTGVHGAV